jgi:hypothetical protein
MRSLTGHSLSASSLVYRQTVFMCELLVQRELALFVLALHRGCHDNTGESRDRSTDCGLEERMDTKSGLRFPKFWSEIDDS